MLSKPFLSLLKLAAYYRSRGMTLADGIEEIYKQYGYYAEKPSLLPFLVWMVLNKSKQLWLNSVTMLLKGCNNSRHCKTEDFEAQTATAADGTVTKLTTPPSDVFEIHTC